MGQQQLLLIVVGIVVVGLAVITGIETFRQQSTSNQVDDVLNRNLRIAQEAMNWRGRATMYGGGAGSFAPLLNDGLSQLGVGDVPYAEHAIVSATGNTLEIVGVSTRAPNVGAYTRLVGSVIDSSSVSTDGSITLP